ncbi:MAG: hypothetical protein ACKON9_27860, partial [Planctomycetaceae bacterium]
FDCYACHHDLKHDGWRQQAQVKGRPGRPRLIPWPATLAELAWQVGSTNANEPATPLSGLLQVQQATISVPFGETPALITAARTAAAAAEQLAAQIEKTRLTPQQQQAITASLLNMGAAGTVDYDSARQLAWSW